jgi:hypothetical protein
MTNRELAGQLVKLAKQIEGGDIENLFDRANKIKDEVSSKIHELELKIAPETQSKDPAKRALARKAMQRYLKLYDWYTSTEDRRFDAEIGFKATMKEVVSDFEMLNKKLDRF